MANVETAAPLMTGCTYGSLKAKSGGRCLHKSSKGKSYHCHKQKQPRYAGRAPAIPATLHNHHVLAGLDTWNVGLRV